MNKLIQYFQENINLKGQLYSKRITTSILNLFNTFKNTKIQPYNISLSQNIGLGEHFNYIPTTFNKYISKHMNFKTTIKTIINNKNINVHIFQESVFFKNKQKINQILKLLNFLTTFSNNLCSKQLDIYIYLTPFKKTLPRNKLQINQQNVNTGFTFACKSNNEIHIYRKEEWFKVLIHECIHAFGLDFSTINNNVLSEFFKLRINMNLSEAYCETLTIIIQSFFINYKNNFIDHFKKVIYNETVFSLTQAAKILNYNNITLQDLIHSKTQNNYSEVTPVFSYFVIKSIYLYFINDFLDLCISLDKNILKNNFNNNDVLLYSNLVKKKSVHKKYLNDLLFIQAYIKQNTNVNNTLKFSFYG